LAFSRPVGPDQDEKVPAEIDVIGGLTRLNPRAAGDSSKHAEFPSG